MEALGDFKHIAMKAHSEESKALDESDASLERR